MSEEELEAYRRDTPEHERDEAEKRYALEDEAEKEEKHPVTNNETDYETIRLLRRIEENTSATHFWTRVTGIPVLIGGMIVFLATAMAECS